MFDINFLKKAGLQSDIEPCSELLDKDNFKHYESKNSSVQINKNNKSHWYYLVVMCVFLFISYSFFLINNNLGDDNSYVEIDIYSFYHILSDNMDVIQIANMNVHDEYLSADFIIDGNENFYNLMSDFSYLLGPSVRGSKFNDNYFIKFNIYKDLNKKSNFSIDELKKEIEDFNLGLSLDLYNNKLIVLLDYNNFINLVDFLDKIKVLDKFQFDIESIDDFELYKVLIYK